MIDFPSSPTVGQIFRASGVNWTWDGFKWTAGGLNVGYLPLTGGTLTGPLTLSADPVAPLQAATMQYVDGKSLVSHANRIINGDMRIDQRFAGTAGVRAPNTYVLDRWFYYATQTGKTQMGINNGNPWSLITNSTSAYVCIATDYFQIAQKIEADQISDCFFGTANAQPLTLSFQSFSTQGGLFSGSIRNDLGTRSYPFTYTLPANAWTNISVTIPGDTSGAWNLLGNGTGLLVGFDLGSGANFRGTPGVWASSNYIGATGAVTVVGTNGANFYLTRVKLEIGSVATPFNHKSPQESMADCQRYYQQLNSPSTLVSGYNSASGSIYCPFMLPVVMRATPTVVLGTSNTANASSLLIQSVDATALLLGATITATGSGYARSALTLSAEL